MLTGILLGVKSYSGIYRVTTGVKTTGIIPPSREMMTFSGDSMNQSFTNIKIWVFPGFCLCLAIPNALYLFLVLSLRVEIIFEFIFIV